MDHTPQSPTPLHRFGLGTTVATPGALDALRRSGQSPIEFLTRHQRGDWGDVPAGDAALNDEAVAHEGDEEQQQRVLSAYTTPPRGPPVGCDRVGPLGNDALASVRVLIPPGPRRNAMSYITLTKTGRALRLTLTPEGREGLQARVDSGQSIDTDSTLYGLLEDHLCDGWDRIRPEEIGALTSAPILSDECSRNDEGEITSTGVVYWHERYQIESAANELLTAGHVDLAASASDQP